MKRFIVLTGSFYPTPSAVGECMYNIVNSLSHDYKIIVISNKTSAKDKMYYRLKNIEIIQFTYTDLEIILGNNKWRKFFNRIYRYLKIILSKYTINKTTIKLYLRELEKLEIKEEDILLSSCFPIEACIAGTAFCKQKGIKHHILLFDRFSSGEKIHRNILNKRIKFHNNLEIENYLFSNATRIYYTDSYNNHLKTYFQNYLYKAVHIEHPLIINCESQVNKNKKKIILYAGSFIPNYVEPYFICQLINSILNKSNNFEFVFYTNDFGKKSLLKLIDKKDKVKINEWVNKEKLDEEMQKSDFFLNVCEKKGNQISSKLFKYISYGKPIINIQYLPNDINTRFLSKYEITLNLDINQNFDNNVQKFINFCSDNYDILSYFEIEKIYPEFTPNYVASQIVKFSEK